MSERIKNLLEKPNPELVSALEALIREVVDRLEEQKDCEHLVAEINALSGQDFQPGFFFELHSWTSERDAAELAAKGAPPALADLTRDELLDIIGVISNANEPESSFLLSMLDKSFPGAWSSDLIYWPHRDMTNDEIVDELLLRQKLYLSGGASAVAEHEVALARDTMQDPDAAPYARQWAEGVLNRC